MSKNVRHLITVAVLVVIGAIVTYFLLSAIYPLPQAASAEAGPIDTMIKVQFMLISFFFALIFVFISYSVVVFRRRPGDEEEGQYFLGNSTLEIVWTIVPLVIVISLGVWAAIVLAEVTEAKPDEIEVKVIGRQWSWLFSYPEYEEIGPSNELKLAVNRPIVLQMTSDDVLHSFWVPEFRVKQDLVPGQVTTLRITPTEIGEYKVICAEICGFDHANMRADVSVLSQSDFDTWIEEQRTNLAEMTMVERGEKWAAEFGCAACHSVDGSRSTGPTWLGLLGREEMLENGQTIVVDELYIRKSILDPDIQIVAGFQSGLMTSLGDLETRFGDAEEAILIEDEVEVDIIEDLIAYILSLQE